MRKKRSPATKGKRKGDLCTTPIGRCEQHPAYDVQVLGPISADSGALHGENGKASLWSPQSPHRKR